ncbi:unnamed protein product [Rhizophagus irregularis]|nr:unnamed protein product [Rhizophagus irregularis]CAB4445116.1 unnamed protein product [Rhizophagus irregularis]
MMLSFVIPLTLSKGVVTIEIPEKTNEMLFDEHFSSCKKMSSTNWTELSSKQRNTDCLPSKRKRTFWTILLENQVDQLSRNSGNSPRNPQPFPRLKHLCQHPRSQDRGFKNYCAIKTNNTICTSRSATPSEPELFAMSN